MKIDRLTPPGGTLRDWIEARGAAGGTGFVFPEGEPPLDWDDLRDTARRIALLLTAQGVAPGESIAIMMPNGFS